MFGPETSDKERAVDKELNGIVPRCIEYLLQCLTERTSMMSRAFSATDDDDDDDNDNDNDNDDDEDDKAPSIIKEWKVYVEFIQIYKSLLFFFKKKKKKVCLSL
ncbi:hypothetical protein RFI_01457 [Reticulomyxa filosa]|uniref:Uncharacterized protein n=1 Tax=Reticulomyxa filosa TaxID=46433 RepID=X6PBP4_RETFI|nr:hypothetical protein RFI_01457 [Reticulomyxa filosa]|eukprot:ETO35606.1 hypothetical protein RFI_01457 [Reticulomyxa filosa]